MKVPEKKKSDFQTVSLFLTLAFLTVLFVWGLRWILLAPAPSRPPTTVESASK